MPLKFRFALYTFKAEIKINISVIVSRSERSFQKS